MTPIDRFTLETHDGPYANWPVKSRLYLDGQPTRIKLPGYQLLCQYEAAGGYILITDYDCPFEESTHFALVSTDLRLRSCRMIGWMYETYILARVEWQDERRFIAYIHGGRPWRFTIRSWGIPYLRPRLRRQLLLFAPEGAPHDQPR